MNTAKQNLDTLHRGIILHVRAYLNGAKPLFLLEKTTIECTGDSVRLLRRVYAPTPKNVIASHISYLGNRDVYREIVNRETGGVYINNIMEFNEPLTVSMWQRIGEIHERNPDATAEQISAEIIGSLESPFVTEGGVKCWLKNLLKKFSSLMGKTYSSTAMVS